jgi:hypothetical protein
LGRSQYRSRSARHGGDRSDLRPRHLAPALSLAHFRLAQEKTIGPLTKLVASLQSDPAKLAKLRAAFEALASTAYDAGDNAIRMPFLMTRATKV